MKWKHIVNNSNVCVHLFDCNKIKGPIIKEKKEMCNWKRLLSHAIYNIETLMGKQMMGFL